MPSNISIVLASKVRNFQWISKFSGKWKSNLSVHLLELKEGVENTFRENQNPSWSARIACNLPVYRSYSPRSGKASRCIRLLQTFSAYEYSLCTQKSPSIPRKSTDTIFIIAHAHSCCVGTWKLVYTMPIDWSLVWVKQNSLLQATCGMICLPIWLSTNSFFCLPMTEFSSYISSVNPKNQ